MSQTPDAAIEVPLLGDGVTEGIVRIGETVRRPVRPFTSSVHTYLAHLHAQGFTAAPQPLGTDDQGREMLSYLPGETPDELLPAWAATDSALVELARLIRRLDDASLGFAPPEGAVWGGVPGRDAPGVLSLFDEPEFVGHRDFFPGNVIFREGMPIGFIDFDLAAPTTRLYEVANALYWWAPLIDPTDRSPALVDADVPARVRMFADAYGLAPAQRHDLVAFAARMITNFRITARASAELDPVFRRMWDDGVRSRMPRAERWIAANTDALNAALR